MAPVGLHSGAPELEVIRASWPGRIMGTIALPVRDHLNSATAVSLMTADFSWLGTAVIDRVFIRGNMLTLQRNEAIRQMRGDWLLFIDDDMVFAPDAIKRLIATRDELDLDILGGLCFRRGAPYHPTLYMREQPTEGYYNFLESWSTDLVEVDATGMAFLVIHKRVFEKIADTPMPPYEYRVSNPAPDFFRWEGRLGEDLRFCQDAKAAGCRVFVDTRIEIGHIGELVIDKEAYLRQMADRSIASVENRRTINDRMGLPTLAPEDARAKLRG